MYASVTFEDQDSVSKVTESSCVVIKGKEVHLEVSSYIITLHKRWENIGSGNLTNLSCFIVSFRKCMLYSFERCHQVNTSKPPVNLAEMRKLNALLAQHPEQAVFIKGIDAQTSHGIWASLMVDPCRHVLFFHHQSCPTLRVRRLTTLAQSVPSLVIPV